MQYNSTPVLLLTGYLGSGKTTLVNHILNNTKGIKFAVIVNDIGEINIDANLIQKGGIVGKKDESLVALQNGCICCTLKMDLIEQLTDIMKLQRFDYIVIEASGICEPEPIARTICSIPNMEKTYTQYGTAQLDCIVTVVDALRMQNEFACGERLTSSHIEEEDIENLLIQQIEFCNIVLLNKASEISKEDREKLHHIIEHLRPGVTIIECDYAQVEWDQILHTKLFNYNHVSGAAGWVRGIERLATEEEEIEARRSHHHEEHHHHHDNESEHHHHEEIEHHHHHHHHHEEGEAEEYGISTFVYYRRQAFNVEKFYNFVMQDWPKNIIRAKGICYFKHNPDMSYLFEQSGIQKKIIEAGLWFATAPKDELMELMEQEPGLKHDWDEKYGDRMEKIVFIGQKMDKEKIIAELDACLEE